MWRWKWTKWTKMQTWRVEMEGGSAHCLKYISSNEGWRWPRHTLAASPLNSLSLLNTSQITCPPPTPFCSCKPASDKHHPRDPPCLFLTTHLHHLLLQILQLPSPTLPPTTPVWSEMAHQDQPQKTQLSYQLIKTSTAATIGGSCMVLSGLTLAGTVIALVVATPLLVIFSPVLVPAAITVFLAASGLVASGGFGVSAVSVFLWLYKYVRGQHPVGADRLDRARDKLTGKAMEVKERAAEQIGTRGTQGWCCKFLEATVMEEGRDLGVVFVIICSRLVSSWSTSLCFMLCVHVLLWCMLMNYSQ